MFDYSKAFTEAKEEIPKKGLSPERKEELQQLTRRDPLDPAPLLAKFADLEVTISEMEEKAKALAVTDDDSSEQASMMAQQAQQIVNKAEKRKATATEKYRVVVNTVNSCVKKFCDRLTAIKSTCENKNLPYKAKKKRDAEEADRAAKAEAAALQAEAEKKRQEALDAAKKAEAEGKEPPPAPAPVVPVIIYETYTAPTKTVTDYGSDDVVRETVWRVTDWAKLPEACFEQLSREPVKGKSEWPHTWIRKQKAAGVSELPGVEFYEVDVLKTRAK